MAISKAPGGVEDLTLGMGTETQIRRGQAIQITQVNADKIPYSETQSTTDKIDQIDGTLDGVRTGLDMHVADRDNPHEVTVDDLGAAWRDHTHPIDDVDGLPQ